MNFFKTIRNLFSRKPSHSGPPAYVYVYPTGKDASNSEVNPNDQVAILRRLSSFVSKKNSPVTIIFPGRPSRKIPDGAKQDGVQARFATSDQLTKVVKECITEFQKTHSIVLAADRSEFQRLADKLGIRYSFASTFTKTLDNVCGAIQRETKPQPPRRQPQPPKNATQPNTAISDATQPAAATEAGEPVALAPTDESPATDSTEPSMEYAESATENVKPESDTPASNATPSSRPKLHRHVPSQKRELTDRAILDLIDPL
jgi:hypothetical protein